MKEKKLILQLTFFFLIENCHHLLLLLSQLCHKKKIQWVECLKCTATKIRPELVK